MVDRHYPDISWNSFAMKLSHSSGWLPRTEILVYFLDALTLLLSVSFQKISYSDEFQFCVPLQFFSMHHNTWMKIPPCLLLFSCDVYSLTCPHPHHHPLCVTSQIRLEKANNQYGKCVEMQRSLKSQLPTGSVLQRGKWGIAESNRKPSDIWKPNSCVCVCVCVFVEGFSCTCKLVIKVC